MDILFENQYKRTETIYKEVYQYFCFKTPIRICFDVLMALILIINIILLVFGYYYCTTLVFFLIPPFLGIQFYQYFKAVKSSVKRQAEVCSSNDLFISISITDDEILSKVSNGAETKTPLAKIKKSIQTKNLIMLQTEAKLLYILPKNTFTKGTLNEFLSFLAEKKLK